MSLGFAQEKYFDELPPNAYSLISRYIEKFGNPAYIADACVPSKIVKTMREKGQNVLSIIEIDAETREPLSDLEIINIANKLEIPVITLNISHFVTCIKCIPLRATGAESQLAAISNYG